MVGPVCLVEPLVELFRRDRAAPEIAMLSRTRGDNAEAAAGAGTDASAARTVNHRRVNLVLAAVAVDCCTRGAGDDRATSALHRAPDQPVDERILERRQGRLAGRGKAD